MEQKEKMIEAIRMLSETCNRYSTCEGCPIEGEICDNTIGNEDPLSPDVWQHSLERVLAHQKKKNNKERLSEMLNAILDFCGKQYSCVGCPLETNDICEQVFGERLVKGNDGNDSLWLILQRKST